MKDRIPAIVVMLAALASAPLFAAEPVIPPQALRAEGENRWQDALAIYQRELSADPQRADLWLRIADIQAYLKRPDQVVRATAEAARIRSRDAALQQRLSQAYSINQQPREALDAIDRALQLSPGNRQYLQARAELALWNNDLPLADSTYRELLAQTPEDTAAQHQLARVLVRQGELDQAVILYQRYCRAHPEDREALLEQARAELYRGDYVAAEELLETYRRAGEDATWKRERAIFLGDSGRPRAAQAALRPLLAANPVDYDLQLVQTKALNGQREPEAQQQLDVLESLGPQRPETAGARLQVETPRRAGVMAAADYYWDTIPLSILRTQAKIQSSQRGRTRLAFEINDWSLRTEAGTGYETLTGGLRRSIQDAWLRLDYQLAPALALYGGAGSAWYPEGNRRGLAQFGVRLRPADTVSIGLDHQRQPVAVSPKAAELAVQRDENRFDFSWQPGYSSTFDLTAAADHYSDGNRRYEIAASPHAAVLRRQSYNLDLGVTALWLSFDRATGNGYYAPEEFRRYWAMAYYYWKGGDNRGISAVLGLGPERDRQLESGYRLGGSLYSEATLGIYRDWQFKAYLGYGSRLDAARYQTGTPHASSVGLQLMRRF